MDAQRQSIIRSALDATDYVRGAQQVEAANARIAQSGEEVVRTEERAAAVTRQKTSAIERLSRELDTAFAAQQRLERAQGTINAAMERGTISAQRAAELQRLAQERYVGTGQAAQQLAVANDNVGRGMSRLTQASQAAGFQIQDFAVQVSAGQSALVAFGQQASQFLGIFGAGGAIAGAVLTVGVLAAQLVGMGDEGQAAGRKIEDQFKVMQKASEDLAGAIREVNSLFLTQEQRAEAAATASRQEIRNRLERQYDIGFQFQEAGFLEINAARQQADAAARRLQLLQRTTRDGRPIYSEQEIDAQRAEVFSANARLAGIQQDISRSASAMTRAAEAMQRLDQIRYGSPIGPEQPSDARGEVDRRRRAREDAARRQAEILARTVYEYTSDPRQTVFPVEALELQARAMREMDQEEQKRREDRAREEMRALDQREAANRRTTDEIVRYGSEAFADLFAENSRGWQGMLDSFLGTFRRLMARIAAEAIIRPIIAPLVGSLGLGGIGDSGGAGGMGGGLLGQLGQLSGLSSFLPSGGLSGLMATPLYGGAIQGPALPGLAASGAPTLGALFGYGAAGALGGGLLAQLTGGNPLGGSVGGGLGAAGGAVLGSIVPGIGTIAGALIGGAAGGGLGGFFGNSGAAFQGGDALITVNPDGTLAVGGAVGKGFNTASLASGARNQVTALNQQLAAAGLFFDPTLANRQFLTAVGGGQSGNPTDLAGALSGFGNTLRSNDPRIQSAIAGAGDFAGALAAAQEAQALIATLDQFAAAANGVTDPLAQVRAQFDAVRATAERLGFGLDQVNAAQQRALAIATAQQDNQRLSSALGQSRILGDFLGRMGTTTGSPQSQFAAAQSQFSAAVEAARRAGGRGADLGRVTSAAQALLDANRAFNATGAEGAAVEGMVRSTLGNLGAGLDLPGFSDDITASLDRWGQAQLDELRLLREANDGMREELRGLRMMVLRGAA